jgi:hypothetical protein
MESCKTANIIFRQSLGSIEAHSVDQNRPHNSKSKGKGMKEMSAHTIICIYGGEKMWKGNNKECIIYVVYWSNQYTTIAVK